MSAETAASGAPRVVVTNDDGIGSEGLRLLAATAAAAGCEVLVAAPSEDASGSSASMAAARSDGRIAIERHELAGLREVPAYAVRAAPGFIAFTAARGGFGRAPAFLLSGINRGPNTGRAILHSGTVGAAMTAVAAGLRAAAFSLDDREAGGQLRWETAGRVAASVIPQLADIPAGVLLNVNIPNLPPDRLRGIRYGRLADYGTVQMQIVTAAEEYLQVTMADAAPLPARGSDLALLAEGYATVTALCPVCEAPGTRLPWASGQAEADGSSEGAQLPSR